MGNESKFPPSSGVSVDGNSIEKGPNGIRVRKPSLPIIGLFENGFDNWTQNTPNGGTIERSTNYVYEGSYSCRLDSTDPIDAYPYITKTVDLDNVENLYIWYYIDTSTSNQYGELAVYIDGNEIFREQTATTLTGDSWTKLDLTEAANYSGEVEIRIESTNRNNSNYDRGLDLYLDKIHTNRTKLQPKIGIN